jgi:hypothetical protein
MTDTIAGPLPPFIPELRQAIRDNVKTQTRRVMKADIPADFSPYQYDDLMGAWGVLFSDPSDKQRFGYVKCPYGAPGQVRYLREPMRRNDHGFAVYLDDGLPVRNNEGRMVPWRWKVSTLSSLFMPAEYARTFVKMARIHIERVQEISAQDAISEGVSKSEFWTPSEMEHRPFEEKWWDDFYFWGHYPQIVFERIWKKINDHRNPAYVWDSNPRTWVLTFSQIRLP